MDSCLGRPLVLVVENDQTNPLGPLGQWLTAGGLELDLRCGPAGQTMPGDLDGYAGLVVLGGRQRANDDTGAPWLPAVRQLLADALGRNTPTLAIGLGAQLLAIAAGGQVAPAAHPEYGTSLVGKQPQACSSDPLFADIPITPDVLQWHVEEVSALPPRSTLLATSPLCPAQAFRVGSRAWGLQFHIETTPATVAEWARLDPELSRHYDVTTILERSTAMHPELAEVWRPVTLRFADVVKDPDRFTVPERPGPAQGPVGQPPADLTDPAAIRAALAAQMRAARG